MRAKTLIEKTGQDGLDAVEALTQSIIAAAVDVGCMVVYGRPGNWNTVNQNAPGPVGNKVRITHHNEGLEVEIYINYIKQGEINLMLAIADLNDDHFHSMMKGGTPQWDAITATVFAANNAHTEYFKDPNVGNRVAAAALWTGTKIAEIITALNDDDQI